MKILRRLKPKLDGPNGREWFLRWLPSRAHDNGMFLVFSNSIGQDEDEVRTGNAMILDPYGRILAETWQAADAIVTAEIDLALLDKCTGQRWIRGRRPELYGCLTQPNTTGLSPMEARFSETSTRSGFHPEGDAMNRHRSACNRRLPPWASRRETHCSCLRRAYRIPFNIAGSYVVARLAPYRPMQHALISGVVGVVACTVGARSPHGTEGLAHTGIPSLSSQLRYPSELSSCSAMTSKRVVTDCPLVTAMLRLPHVGSCRGLSTSALSPSHSSRENK